MNADLLRVYKCLPCGHEWPVVDYLLAPDSCPRCGQPFVPTARTDTIANTLPRDTIRLLGAVAALERQEGGSHYKDMPIQPVEYIHKNGIGYFEGNVIKYVSRWRAKNGIEDLKKARHYIDLLIEMETTSHD